MWCWNTSSNIWVDKSFAYDLNKERGIVSMRVDLCHDLLRLSLCSGDLLPKQLPSIFFHGEGAVFYFQSLGKLLIWSNFFWFPNTLYQYLPFTNFYVCPKIYYTVLREKSNAFHIKMIIITPLEFSHNTIDDQNKHAAINLSVSLSINQSFVSFENQSIKLNFY